MKECPTCKRTYPDDGFAFCLADGALLSAPFDPDEKSAVETIRASGPPPTAVLPGARPNADLRSTVAAAPPEPIFKDVPRNASRSFGRVFLIAGAGLLIVAGGIYSIVTKRSHCPQFKVSCYGGETGMVGCEVSPIADSASAAVATLAVLRTPLALQAPAFPHAKTVTWSSSAGTVESQYTMARISGRGLSGQKITVNATVDFDSGCSRTISTTYLVPASDPIRK